MADVSYSVEVSYLQKGSLSGPSLKSIGDIEKRLGGLKNMTQGIGDSLGSSLSKGVATFLAADAVRSAAHSMFEIVKVGLIDMNAEMEQASITMATMFTAHGNTQNFERGLGASRELLALMRKDAAALPGEFKDLQSIMTRMITPSLNAGLSIRQTEQLAANAMALGVGSGMNSDVVGRELGDMIQGRMRKNMPLLKVLPNFNMDSHAFNAMPIEKRVERLQKALGMAGGPEADAINNMKDAFQDSWIGLTTTLKDKFKILFGDMTFYLFERMKYAMAGVSNWFTSHGDEITKWAKDVGWMMANGFQVAYEHLMRLGPMILKIGHFLGKEAKEGKLFGDIEKVGAVLAGVKAASMVAPVAGSLASGTPGMLTGATTALGGVGAMVGLEGAAAALAGLGVVLGIVAAAAVAVYGAFEVLSNAASPLHDTVVALWFDIEASLKSAGKSIYHAFKTAEPALTRISEVVGGVLIANLSLFADILEGTAKLIDAAVTAIAESWGKIKELIDRATFGTITPLLEADKKVSKLLTGPEEEYHPRGNLDRQVKTPEAPKHTTHIHKVDINVNSNQDPSRVAELAAERLMDLARYPRQSPYNPSNVVFR